jgi:hypothetical protein
VKVLSERRYASVKLADGAPLDDPDVEEPNDGRGDRVGVIVTFDANPPEIMNVTSSLRIHQLLLLGSCVAPVTG